MTSRHHPDDLTLMGFAAGSLAEPLAAVVAGHLAGCARCRMEMRLLERVGQALVTAPSLAAGSPLSLPDRAAAADRRPGAHPPATAPDLLPEPLRRRFGITFDTIRWYRLAPGLRHHRLPLSPGTAGDLRLIEAAPGVVIPEHGHSGAELTLVLRGGFSDETGHYVAGDVQDVDGDIEHRPMADLGGCVCLVASEGPMRFTGLGARLLQSWHKL